LEEMSVKEHGVESVSTAYGHSIKEFKSLRMAYFTKLCPTGGNIHLRWLQNGP
jgi:hypothetical protein